jgi:hypothetical protein
MTERVADPPVQKRVGKQGSFPMGTFRLRSALACIVVALALAGGATSTQAGNGEPVGGEGYYRPPTCDFDITLDCDDRFDLNADSGIVSCHMRGSQGDEGLAVKACRAGRLADEAFLERDVTIQATAFGQIICGQGANDFCLVCETFTTSGGNRGARRCVRIVNNGQTNAPGTCGAFNVINDTTGMCSSEIGELQQTFSDPRLGFFIDIDASAAGNPAEKDLVLCGGRSWQCINNPQPPLATGAAVQEGQAEAVIDTPACFVRSGRSYCY